MKKTVNNILNLGICLQSDSKRKLAADCRQRKKFLCSTVFLLQLKKTFAFRGGMYNDVQTING
ncbi:hypothetical protein E1H99_07935 [Enterococcus hirae]|nr:hypothetical protein E1H99_07935 [Enterococcus hirae]